MSPTTPPEQALAAGTARRQHTEEPRPTRWVRLLPLLVPLGVVAWMAFTRRWVADDAYINFRVVDNLFAGHGPVFNAGERVEVATSTIWLGVLAGLALLLPDAVPLPVAAVAAGLALTLVGLAAAQAGAVVLVRGWGRTGVALPAGVLVLAALPPVWDFATSGLENGLTTAWLGGCFLALALRCSALRSHAEPAPAYRPVWLAVLVGLGPLIRPDFAVLSLAFGIALLATSRRSAASWLGGGATALALPVGYQLFRMGFYATLVPNTALAKSATSSQWEQGLTYLGDFAGLYWLVLPLAALLLAVLGPQISARWTSGDRATVVVLVAPVVGGLVHAAYVIRVGGDFMHGRLLLPATMAIVLPVAAVVVPPWPPDRSVRRALIGGAVALVGPRGGHFGAGSLPRHRPERRRQRAGVLRRRRRAGQPGDAGGLPQLDLGPGRPRPPAAGGDGSRRGGPRGRAACARASGHGRGGGLAVRRHVQRLGRHRRARRRPAGPSPPYASLDLRKVAIYGRQLLPEPLDLSQQPLGGGRGQRWRHDQ